jgi:NarL family two-component system response regulator LiaR
MAGRIRVFLADDHTVLREAPAELVDNQPDMEVVGQASTGQDTIELVKLKRPDVVVMDIAMPRMDGLEATRLIVADCPEIHVMVLSAHQDADHILPLLEAGATSYLPKTIGLNELLEAIRATSRGESILPPEVASVVIHSLSGKSEAGRQCDLTPRELEVLSLVAQGCTNELVALRLNLSTRTVEAHMTHIFNKLNVSSRTEAALLAQRKGWLNLEE